MEQLSAKVDGDTILSSLFNQLPAEIQSVITTSGLFLAADLNQFAIALANYAGVSNFYIGGGTANAQFLDTVVPYLDFVRYVDGLVVHWRPLNANTGATTIQVDGFTVRDLVKESNGLALAANDLITTKDAKARFDDASGDFFLLGV